jgi:hypothetical protein
VNISTSANVVMMAQGGLDLTKRFMALHLSLPFPKHHKALAAYAATGFNAGIGAFQENLHGEISSGVCWVSPSHTMKVAFVKET